MKDKQKAVSLIGTMSTTFANFSWLPLKHKYILVLKISFSTELKPWECLIGLKKQKCGHWIKYQT